MMAPGLFRCRGPGSVPLLEGLVGRPDASTPEVWAARAHRTPEAPFLRWEGRVWTYDEAWLEIRRFAGLLESAGMAGSERRVATFLTNCPEAIWSWFGTHTAGSVLVPINRNHRGPILADMLARSGAGVLVTEPSALEVLPDLAPIGVERVLITGTELRAGARSSLPRVTCYRDATDREPFLAARVRFADLATVMYTSGTTGRSKAVRLPHNMFWRGGARVAEALGVTEPDVFHNWLPLYHIAGQLHVVCSTVVAGGSVALYPTFSRSGFWDQVAESGATLFGAMPNVLQLLWDLPERPGGDRSTLRAGLIGISPKDLHRAFEDRFGLRLVDSYGMTEMEPITLPDPTRPTPARSCGVPNHDIEVAIMDPHGVLVAPGEPGEIMARPRASSIMMQGYEGDDAATVALWRDLWWHTGDLGRFDRDGFLYIEGRLKQMIRRRGENISAWELEEAVKSHPHVLDAAAVGVPSVLGEDDVKVVVVPRPNSGLEPGAVHRYCSERLARFMVPRYVELREALPFSFIGKVDRDALRQATPETWDAERPS